LRIPASWVRIGAALLTVAAAAACASSPAAGPARAGQGSARGRTSGAPGPPDPSPPGTAGTQPPAGPARGALPVLTARQMAGQRVIYSYGGLTPPAGLLRLIRHGEAAGVIFFAANFSSEAQISAAIHRLDQANASRLNPVRSPLLLMTDQEGGIVRRLPGQPVLSEKQIGESAAPPAQATRAGAGAGRNLRGVGMNVNLAPVLDVYRQAGDFTDMFGRSYSANPGTVSRLGADFITAQQAAGVAATAKHFPGLGAAAVSQNTDSGPVTLPLSRAAIRTVDELPYQAAISAGVKLIMVSWATYPALDAARPAGLSSAVVQGELRERLRFGGVTITDALEAGALRAFGSISARAQLAARAGMDLILCSAQTAGEGEEAMSGLASGYRDDTLSHAAFKASLQRILALRASLPG
jgi:beta-N-acetylhexosaminidase